MDKPGIIKVTRVDGGWRYECVYMLSETHKDNLDIYYYKDGNLIDMVLDTHHIIVPDNPHIDYAIRIHRN